MRRNSKNTPVGAYACLVKPSDRQRRAMRPVAHGAWRRRNVMTTDEATNLFRGGISHRQHGTDRRPDFLCIGAHEYLSKLAVTLWRAGFKAVRQVLHAERL